MEKKKIIGLGSSLLDIQAELLAEFLEKYGFTLNNTYFAEEKHLPLYEELIHIPFHISCSCSRRIQSRWMAQAGQDQVNFIGCVGQNDKFANMLVEVTNKDGMTTFFDVQAQPTDKCEVLLCNQNGCFVSSIGAAAHLSDTYVDQHIENIKTATVLFSEVYSLYSIILQTKTNDILAVLPFVDQIFHKLCNKQLNLKHQQREMQLHVLKVKNLI